VPRGFASWLLVVARGLPVSSFVYESAGFGEDFPVDLRGSCGITVRIPDQILHRLRQFRLLAAYPRVPPVKVP